jgi:Icc-related predicted phosphoesterase
MEAAARTIRIAALADLHVTRSGRGMLEGLLAPIAASADILLLCGDLTDHGIAEEARLLAGELAKMTIPRVGVLGNHDYDAGQAKEVKEILTAGGTMILDGDACEVRGVGFAGTKGFAGGFGQRMLAPWGEQSIKSFVNEAIVEALKLESSLAKLRMEQRIAVLHYAPIRATVEGEPLEILPFLGSSRLEEPLNRYPVTAVFHGHAHNGTFEGRSQGNVPVYNVSLPLLRKTFPNKPPFFVYTVTAS